MALHRFQILFSIVQLLDLCNSWQSHISIWLTLSTKFSNTCIICRNTIGRQLHGFFNTLLASLTHDLLHRYTKLSLVGFNDVDWGVILIIGNPPLVTVSISVQILFSGPHINKRFSQEVARNQNIGALPPLLLKSNGLYLFCMNFGSLSLSL